MFQIILGKCIKPFLIAAISFIFYYAPSLSYAEAQKPIVGQFFGIWLENKQQKWEDKFRPDTPFKKLNRLYIAFAKIVPSGKHFTIAFDGEEAHVEDLIQRMKEVNPNAEIFLSLNGNNESFMNASHPDEIKYFTQNVIAFLQHYKFNGLDVDWEFESDWTTDKYKKPLNTLMTNLYPALHDAGYKLTYDLMPGKKKSYDMPVLIANVDQFNIMSYGCAVYPDVAEKYTDKFGVPLKKIILGVITETSYNENGDCMDTLGANGTLAKKAQYTLQHKLAGIMEWRLDNDNNLVDPNRPTYKGAEELWEYICETSAIESYGFAPCDIIN